MKKKILILTIGIFGLAAGLSSCGKTYTCTCTDENGNVTKQNYTKVTKASAEESCGLQDDFEDQDCTLSEN